MFLSGTIKDVWTKPPSPKPRPSVVVLTSTKAVSSDCTWWKYPLSTISTWAKEGRENRGSLVGFLVYFFIFLFFFRLDLAQNACCVGVLTGCKWMTKALCHPVCHLMSNTSTLQWCCVLQLLYFVLKEKILPVCMQVFVCVAWVFVFVSTLRVSPNVISPFLYRLSMSNIWF